MDHCGSLWDRCGSLWVVVGSLWIIVDRCGSLWIIVDHCGSFRVLVIMYKITPEKFKLSSSTHLQDKFNTCKYTYTF